jgi:transposase
MHVPRARVRVRGRARRGRRVGRRGLCSSIEVLRARAWACSAGIVFLDRGAARACARDARGARASPGGGSEKGGNTRSIFPSEAVRIMEHMDRVALEQMLDQGMSLAEIGRRFDRHESTVAYWVEKYGLEAVNRARVAPRGGLERCELERLVVRRLSIAEIAREVGRSKATVRHWLRRYGLRTNGKLGRRPQRERALARAANLDVVVLTCRYHGDTEFWLNARGYYRCKQCRSEAVTRRRRKMKALLVEEAGGACSLCGYARSVWALHFTTWSRPKSATRSMRAARVWRSRDCAPRRTSACSSAPTATPRSRRGWSRSPARTMLTYNRTAAHAPLRGSSIRGSSTGRRARLLTERLWVRVPPPELVRHAAASAPRPPQPTDDSPAFGEAWSLARLRRALPPSPQAQTRARESTVRVARARRRGAARAQ